MPTHAPSTPTLELLMQMEVKLTPPLDLGASPRGVRRIIPIVGGNFTGDRLNGEIVNLGADWQTVFPEGAAELDTRYVLRTDDGAIIDVRNFGYRRGPAEVLAAVGRGETVDPALYYMRTQCRFETGDPRYAWLNTLICIGSGARLQGSVLMHIYAVN